MTVYKSHPFAALIMETPVAIVTRGQNNLQHRAYVCGQRLVSPGFLGLVTVTKLWRSLYENVGVYFEGVSTNIKKG